MSALLNLSIQRIEAWFCTVLALPPIARGGRLLEINNVLLNALKMIDFHAHEDYDLYRDLLVKVIVGVLFIAQRLLCCALLYCDLILEYTVLLSTLLFVSSGRNEPPTEF